MDRGETPLRLPPEPIGTIPDIDATVRFFLQKFGKLLPSWFLEAIKDQKK